MNFPIEKFNTLETPFYYYDTELLRQTLQVIKHEASRYPQYHVHYAVKANANSRLLSIIRENGLGADCVSGGEIGRLGNKTGTRSRHLLLQCRVRARVGKHRLPGRRDG